MYPVCMFVSITNTAVALCHTAHSQHRFTLKIPVSILFYNNCASNLCNSIKMCTVRQPLSVPALPIEEWPQVSCKARTALQANSQPETMATRAVRGAPGTPEAWSCKVQASGRRSQSAEMHVAL